ncbi:uroporphyrinogen-III C-methyltransferase [Billgrantia saliphila]|uniref:uroporphyrinogen-III C-methyltransferase n=1 Tax=Billgrantia saliphila TaxID=1848458 RepID=UPI000CE32583|nr:uroporphyrinogen-III C-methyltransferase [Halomonas saliphila]
MSKQTNDKDEQKTPSAGAQGSKGRETEDRSGGSDRASGHGNSPQSPGEGKAGEGKPATAASDAAGPGDAKGTVGASSEAAKPGADTAGAKSSGDRSGQSAPAVGDKPGQGSSDAPSGAAAGQPPTGRPDGDDRATGKSNAADKNSGVDKGGAADKRRPKAAGQDKSTSQASAGTDSARDSARSSAAAGGTGANTGTTTSGSGKGGGRVAGVLALILVLFLGIGSGLFAWNTWERLDAQQQRLAELEEQAGSAASADELADLREQLESGEQQRDAELTEAVESMRNEFAGYRSEVDEALDQVLEELSREQNTDEREWLHAEAAYLLRLANQRLQLERDVEGAAALLRTADARLSEADNPALLSIRRAIASELSILDSVPQVDRTGLYLALNAQQERLAELPLSRELEEIPARSGIEEAPTGGWQEQLASFGQELKDLIVIRHHDEALEGLVAPEQESYLRQSARLVIEQAQLALLEEEQALYEASLDKALELIGAFYDTEHDEVQAVIERLEELRDETIQPELPDISGSHEALQEFIERRFGSRGEQGDDA